MTNAESAKRQGASRSHWLAEEERLKNELVTLTEARKLLQNEMPSRPGALIPPKLKEQLDKVNAEIEAINDVRRDIAAELEQPAEPPESGWRG